MKHPTPSDDTANRRKLHYFMVAGNVIYREDDDVQSIMANAVITTDVNLINVHALGKAQQALQASLFRKMGEPKNVVDVVLLGIIPLGRMSPQEFNAPPPGLTVVERSAANREFDPDDPFSDGLNGMAALNVGSKPTPQ
jgi:hypothetical protein